jgi:hypothetical protein
MVCVKFQCNLLQLVKHSLHHPSILMLLRAERNRSFDTLLTLIDRHLVDAIIPKCNPKYLWLPDLTGKGWRSDLGIPRGDRFTLWL